MSSCNDCIQIYLRHNSPSVHRYKASLNWINANDKVEPEKVVGPWGLNLKNPFKAWSIDNVITSSDIDCFCNLRFYFHHLSWKYPCHCPGFVFFPQLLSDHFIVPCSKMSIGRRPTHFYAFSTVQPLWNRSDWSSTAPHCSTSPSSCPARSHPAKSCNSIFALNFASSYHGDGGRRRSWRFLVLRSVWDRSSCVPCVRLRKDYFKISSSICFLLVLEIALCFLRLLYLLLPQVLVHCQVLLPGLLLVSSKRINSQRMTHGRLWTKYLYQLHRRCWLSKSLFAILQAVASPR